MRLIFNRERERERERKRERGVNIVLIAISSILRNNMHAEIIIDKLHDIKLIS